MLPQKSHDLSSPRFTRMTRAFTLVELLIVVTIVGILASVAITHFEPSVHDQLVGAAQILASDFAYGRSLGVANNTNYRYTFDLTNAKFWLEHSGSNAAFNNLPDSPYRQSSDPRTRQTTDLRRFPGSTISIDLAAVRNIASPTQVDVKQFEFGPLGALVQTENCVVWLSAGNGASKRYLPIEISAITGLTKMGAFTTTGPPAI